MTYDEFNAFAPVARRLTLRAMKAQWMLAAPVEDDGVLRPSRRAFGPPRDEGVRSRPQGAPVASSPNVPHPEEAPIGAVARDATSTPLP